MKTVKFIVMVWSGLIGLVFVAIGLVLGLAQAAAGMLGGAEMLGGFAGAWQWLIIIVVIGVPIYLIPTVVATRRKHHQRLAITVLNLLTGWTFLGWIAALVWACTAVRPRA